MERLLRYHRNPISTLFMASLYKPTYTKCDPETGERVTRRLRKWYAKYNDADGVVRRVALCEDKSAAQVMLADLMRKVERQQAGMIDPAAEHLAQPIDVHVRAYETHLKSKARSDKHVDETMRLIRNVSAACRCKVLADLQGAGDRLENYLAERRDNGASFRTINADLVAVRSFCRWLMQRQRMHQDPTSDLVRLNVDEDRRRERRALTDVEAQRLIDTAWESKRVFRRLNGKDRALLYMLAQRTGLRRGELRTLTAQSFNLTSNPPIVVVEAKNSKRRKKDVLPLAPEVAHAMKDYLDERDSKRLIWSGSWWRRAAEMMHKDLAEAGIESIDEDGRVLDFHGQRTTFITGLARSGVSPATAQRLARHSDINLTMGVYTQLEAGELANAVGNLPKLILGDSACENGGDQLTADSGHDADRLNIDRVVAVWPQLSAETRAAIFDLIDRCEGDT